VFGWGERTYKALNACVQGGVAEMMSELMLAVEERWPGMLVNQVHDSLWLEIPDELVDEVGRWVKAEGKRLFESAFQTKTLKVAFKFDGARLA
jgi:DNA polymerase I-like protein with 3'-5' exonuclease and polymerase domains